MKLETVLNHFNTNPSGLAKILDLDASTVRKWETAVPLDKAALLNKISYGALTIDWSLYDQRGKPIRKAA